MSEYLATALVSLGGLCVLIIAVVVLTIRGKGERAVSWRGLGVTFEIKPCTKCTARRS